MLTQADVDAGIPPAGECQSRERFCASFGDFDTPRTLRNF
jgi:hypothetical protein